jgi:large subunit ribosomal protein L5
MPRSDGVKPQQKKTGTVATSTVKRRSTKKPVASALAEPAKPLNMKPRLLEKYRSEVRPQLIKEMGYRNPMEAPRLQKVVLNIGLAEALQNPKAVEAATRDLEAISGQKAVVTKSRKAIAAFKLREGMPIGVTVTLRGNRMYDLLDRLVNSALPRIRDFRGVPRESFDGRGNFSLGIREQVIFPEIDYNQVDRIRGLQLSVVTTARNNQEALRLLELIGVPFASTGAKEN